MHSDASPCDHGLDRPECPVCRAISYGGPRVFAHASGPWETSKVWVCADCCAHGDFDFDDSPLPRAHVEQTGHTVTLTRTTEMTLFPLATQPPG